MKFMKQGVIAISLSVAAVVLVVVAMRGSSAVPLQNDGGNVLGLRKSGTAAEVGMPRPAPKIPGRSYENGDVICAPLTLRPKRLTPSCETYKLSSKFVENCTLTGNEYTLPLLISSTGRSGTTHMQKVLTRMGYKVTHDNGKPKQGTHGGVNWVAAFEDTEEFGGPRYPSWAHARGIRYSKVFLQTRNPERSIASRITGSPCSEFQSFWHATSGERPGEPLSLNAAAGKGCVSRPLDRVLEFTISHFVSWHEFLYQVADYSYRLEDYEIGELIHKGGLGPPRRPYTHSVSNSSNTRPHPDFTWDNYYKLNREATVRAGRLAMVYGYCIPAWLETHVEYLWNELPLWTPTLDFLPADVKAKLLAEEQVLQASEGA